MTHVNREQTPVVLGVETSGATGGIALMSGTDQLGMIHFSLGGPQHSQLLLPAIKEILVISNMSLCDISCIAVSQGPGSFTGLRIGLSVSNAIGWFLNIPIIGIDTMESFAFQAMQTIDINESRLICTISDAKQGKYYYALFRIDLDGKLERLDENRAGTLDDIVLSIKDPTYFCGDVILRNRSDEFAMILKDRFLICSDTTLPSPLAIARMGSRKFALNQYDQFISEPNYVRVGYHKK